MPQPKRTSSAKAPANKLVLAVPKPRNAVLQAAALGKVKLGTEKHEKSKGALRRAEKVALLKATKSQTEN